jgi:hypothetical protein
LLVVLAAIAAFGYFGRSEPKDGMVPAAVAALVALLLVVISRSIGRRGAGNGGVAAGQLQDDEADVGAAGVAAAPDGPPALQAEMAVAGRAVPVEVGAVATAEAGFPTLQPNGVVAGDRVNGLFSAVGSATERAVAVDDEPAPLEAPPPLWGSPRARADELRRQNAGEVPGRAQSSEAAQINNSAASSHVGAVDEAEAARGVHASSRQPAGLQTEQAFDGALQYPAQGDRPNGFDLPSAYEPAAGFETPSGFDRTTAFDDRSAFETAGYETAGYETSSHETAGHETAGHEAFTSDEPTPTAERPLDMAAGGVRPRMPEVMAWHTDDELREVGELLVALHRRFGVSYRSHTWVDEVLPTCSLTPMDPILTRDLLAAAALEAGGVAVDRASFSLLRDEAEVNNVIGHLHMALIELEARLARAPLSVSPEGG